MNFLKKIPKKKKINMIFHIHYLTNFQDLKKFKFICKLYILCTYLIILSIYLIFIFKCINLQSGEKFCVYLSFI